jgi:hypothetical protein
MARVLWHVTMSLDGVIAGLHDGMGWVFEYQDPNVTVEGIIRTTGLVLDRRPMLPSSAGIELPASPRVTGD